MGSVNGKDAIDASGKAASPDRIILVVCPTHRDYRELPRISPPGIDYIFHDYASTSLEDLVSNPDRAKDLAADPLDEIDAILAKVDSGNGSASKLLNDPGVYNDVRGLLQRMDSLLADIKKNPKRYINVKIF